MLPLDPAPRQAYAGAMTQMTRTPFAPVYYPLT